MAAGAIKRWAPKAAKVKQIDTITIGGTSAGADTNTVAIGSAETVVTIGSLTSTSQVATTLKQAFEGETLTDATAAVKPESPKTVAGQFALLTATVSGSVVTVTGPAGQPFTMSVTNTGSGTATEATSQAATGPEHFDNADNWEGGVLPQDDDNWSFEHGSFSCKYGLVTGLQPRNICIPKSFTGQIGLPAINRDTPSLPYLEYRQQQLKLENAVTPSATEIFIGKGEGAGSSLIRIDVNDCNSVETWIYGTAAGIDNAPAVLLKGPTLLPDRWIQEHPEHIIERRVQEALDRAQRKREERAERRRARGVA